MTKHSSDCRDLRCNFECNSKMTKKNNEQRELKHCFAMIHKDAIKYEDWIMVGLPTDFGNDWECVELKEITPESESELVELRRDRMRLNYLIPRLSLLNLEELGVSYTAGDLVVKQAIDAHAGFDWSGNDLI